MATLAGNTIASTYPLLLKVDSNGLDGTLRAIQDGDATDSVLYLATDSALISGNGTKLYFFDADGGEHISANNGGVLSIAGGSEIDLTATAIDINGTVNMSSTLEVEGVLTVAKNVSAGSAAKDTPFLTLSATDAGVNMSGGEGASILFKIPDDETNPSIGASIAGIKENSDDSLSQTALSFNVSQNDETLDEMMRIASDGKVGINTANPIRPLSVSYGAAKTSTSTAYAMSIQSNESSGQAALQFYAVGGASAAVRKFQLQTTEVGVANAGIIEFQPDGGTINFVGAPTFNTDITIKDAHPEISFLDTDDNSDSRIYHSAGSLYIDADYNGEVADTKIRFTVDDAQKFVINANSIISLSNNDNGTSNTIFGDSAADSLDAGSNFNVFIGKSVATGSLDDASDNVGIGFESMKAIIQGDDNVALGMRTLLDLEDGNNNTAIGDSVLRACVDSSDNTAVGAYAMDATTTGNNNVAMGKNALGNTADVDKCVSIGSAAMSQSNITSAADGSVAVGYFALGNLTTGENNIAIGQSALISHTTGHRNIAIGRDAMGDTDAGTSVASSDNIFIGLQAGGGAWVADSKRNVGIGNYAMDTNMNGADYNVSMGYNTLTALTTGIANTAIGYSSSNAVVGGNYNTVLGSSAAGTLTSGSNNTCVGQSSNVSASGASNQQVFGDGATGQGDNYAVIGNASVTRVYGAQDAGATFYGAGQSWSDARIKENVKDIGLGLDFIKKLTPIQFTKKQPKDYEESLKSKISGNLRDIEDTELKRIRPGFIAQDVLEVLEKSGFSSNNSMVQIDEKTTQHSMDYESMVVPLVKAVQELNAKVEELETKLNNKES